MGWLARLIAGFEAWTRRRAEKNRRFKIPCHLGVGRGRRGPDSGDTE